MSAKTSVTTRRLTVNLSLKNSVVVMGKNKDVAIGNISVSVDLDSVPKGITTKTMSKLLKGVLSGYRYDDNGNFIFVTPNQKVTSH